MIIKPNTTIVDVAFNLYGSLAGIPAVLKQLPVGSRIGFDDIPLCYEDVDDIGQTWTPELSGVSLDIVPVVYNPEAVAKAPFSTDVTRLANAVSYGERLLSELYDLVQ